MREYWIKVQNINGYLFTRLILFFLSFNDYTPKKDTLLLIRLDAIGDYILFRNFIKILKEDDKYKNYSITLLGNKRWEELSEILDKDIVDNFIFIDKEKFYSNFLYRFKILKGLKKNAYEVILNPVYNREILFGDSITAVFNKSIKITGSGALDKHLNWKLKFFTNKTYTELIELTEKTLFEFSRNKEFFEKLLNKKINLVKPFIEYRNQYQKFPDKFFVIIIGAKDLERRWGNDNFVEIINKLTQKYKIPVLISAAPNEIEDYNYIKKNINPDFVIPGPLFGLQAMLESISQCLMVISNDTSGVHVAASLNKPFVCISNGDYFGRFTPYPKDIYDNCVYIYPEILENIPYDTNINDFKSKNNLDIKTITPGYVFSVLDQFIIEKKIL